MASTSQQEHRDEAPLQKKLDDLYKLIDGIDVAMLTTRRPDGSLVSRPMQVQECAPGFDLWFVTDIESHKLDELESDPHVNCAFYKEGSREWVSVSGRAEVVTDRKRIRELYEPDWKAWFGDEGGERNGGPDDPRLALIVVEAQSVVYSKNNKPRLLALYEVAKAVVTGDTPDVADVRHLEGHELH